jgi:hypothetical protein
LGDFGNPYMELREENKSGVKPGIDETQERINLLQPRKHEDMHLEKYFKPNLKFSSLKPRIQCFVRLFPFKIIYNVTSQHQGMR